MHLENITLNESHMVHDSIYIEYTELAIYADRVRLVVLGAGVWNGD